MAGRRYLVLGSNCFTGAHIVDALLADGENEVVGVSRSEEYHPIFLPYRQRSIRPGAFRFRRIDFLKDPAALAALLDDFKPAVVIHPAGLSEVALSNERPLEYYETNTVATVRLCERLRRAPYLERYVYVSSAEIFGHCDRPADEDTPFRPSTPYAVSKAAADMHVQTLIRNHAFPALIIRSTNVFGRHQQLFKIIPRSAIFLKTGRTIELHGGGGSVKSFVHIRDVVDGLLEAVRRGRTGAYHLSTDEDRSIADIVALVCRKMGRDFGQAARPVGERLGQDGRYRLDCGRAHRELDWRPKVAFETGVEETIAWIEGNWEAVRTQPLQYIHKN